MNSEPQMLPSKLFQTIFRRLTKSFERDFFLFFSIGRARSIFQILSVLRPIFKTLKHVLIEHFNLRCKKILNIVWCSSLTNVIYSSTNFK